MATAIVMPKQGNTVENVIIVGWKKQVGDSVAVDDALCEVETDKATLEVPSTVAGTLLATLFAAGDEVPVMAPIAWIGEAGESVGGASAGANAGANAVPTATPAAKDPAAPAPQQAVAGRAAGSSPRARALAERSAIDVGELAGSGPGGRVIERDVLAAVQPKLTPVARAMVAEGGFAVPTQGSGPGGRVTSRDLRKEAAPAAPAAPAVQVIPVRGVRKVIAERMLQSLQTTAQLSLNAAADARVLQALRARFKASPEAMGLRGVTLNDLLLWAVARTLPAHPALNALFVGGEIHQHRHVQLGIAVDTPRGLMVPVVRQAEQLTLRQLSVEAKRLASACLESKITPDELVGGTFTVTNLGALGIESFTPVLNAPQVAILGVASIQLRPVEADGGVQFVPHIGLSLTINHQVIDGAPAARFLQALSQAIGSIDLLLAG